MAYDDPRLAVLYDIDNPDGPAHDFLRALADERGARDIIDLGCGTGILTVTLTAPGRTVTGIDPAPIMLERARSRAGGDRVTWVQGTAEHIAQGSADLIVMSGNVAMHIVQEDWPAALQHIARGLRAGGALAFESHNPEARAWERWNEGPVERDTPFGRLRKTSMAASPDGHGIVEMHVRKKFLADGDAVEYVERLQFRTHAQIVDDLAAAGLVVQATYRNWNREPFRGGAEEPLMVFVAVPGES